MSEERTERALRDWLRAAAPDEVPAGLLRRADEIARRRLAATSWLARAMLPVSVALVTVAVVIAVVGLFGGLGPPAVSGSAAPSASQSSLSSSPAPSGAAGLAPGETLSLDCHHGPPAISRAGDLLACGGEILRWPTLARVAPYAGTALGWGDLSGRQTLLVGTPGTNQFSVVDGETGQVTGLPGLPLDGQQMATWSPDGGAVWLTAGLQTDQLALYEWTPEAGLVRLGRMPVDGREGGLTASPDRTWLAGWSTSCAQTPPDCTTQIWVRRAGDLGAAIAVGSTVGLVDAVEVDGQGTVGVQGHFSASDAGGNLVFLEHGGVRQGFGIVAQGRAYWSLADGSFAVATSEGLIRVDPLADTQQPIALNSVSVDRVLGVSPDARWVLAESAVSATSVALGPVDAVEPAFSVPGEVTPYMAVIWDADRYVVFSDGQPLQTTVVRLGG